MARIRFAVTFVAVVSVMVLSSCGASGDPAADNTTTTAQDGAAGSESTPSTPTDDSGTQGDTTTSMAAQGDANGLSSDNPRTDVSHATVIVGDELFMFAQVDENGQFDDNGVCDPEFLGIQFKAILHQIDDQGNTVRMEDTGDLVMYQGATLAFTDEGPEQGIVTLNGWQAAVAFGKGSVDSVTFDGNTARGTASFVDEDGANPTEGSFEVVCVN
jgi:hypothetical protein